MNTKKSEVVLAESQAPVVQSANVVTPMQLLQIATQQGADVDKLGKLMEMQFAWEANEARKAFVSAMNEFKANPPRIEKTKLVDFATSKGRTTYKHATLDKVSDIIGEALSKVGISHRWDVTTTENGQMQVSCVLTHSMGHSERVTLPPISRDDSGGKNNIQALGSALTYAQRYSLLAATGMATSDQDDDGQGGKGPQVMPDNQKADWLAEIDSLASRSAGPDLLKRMGSACTAIGDVPSYAELRAAYARKMSSLPAEAKGEPI